jgi:monofunctional chorismate mutase
MEIKELREEIDTIDKELVALFLRRMECSSRVAEYKREHSLPILDEAREKDLLDRIAALSGEEFAEYSKELYATILKISRDHQKKFLTP